MHLKGTIVQMYEQLDIILFYEADSVVMQLWLWNWKKKIITDYPLTVTFIKSRDTV